MNVFALSFLMMLVLVLIELAILRRARGQAIPWTEVIFNLNSGHILMWVLRGVEVLAFAWVLRHASLGWVGEWPPVVQWIFAFIGWDFCFYWMHRMHHKLPFFWAVHVVHHQGEHFNLSLGIRNSWYSSLTNFPFVAILAVLGVPLEIFVTVSSIHYSVQFYNHNGLVGKSGWLDKFLVTPSNHRVHHGTAAIYIDKNFGGTFLLWDKLFGTYQAERADIEMRYGVRGAVASNNPLWANNPGLLRFLQGLLPALRDSKRFHVPPRYIGCGGVLLFGLVIWYVNREGRAALDEQVALFSLLFLATIALGAISDERRWGLLGWIALWVASPPLFLTHFQLRDPWALALFGGLLLHALDGVRRMASKDTDAMNAMPAGTRGTEK